MSTTAEPRKWIKVYVEKRRNPPKRNGKRTVSYTLEWSEFGQRRFMSLGPGATKGFADSMARAKEAELNQASPEENLKPITFSDFKRKFLETNYPGYDLPAKQRREFESQWGKQIATMRAERDAMKLFESLVNPKFCHDITSEDRETFIQERMGMDGVGSGDTVNKELRLLRHLFNVMEEWHHRLKETNPFSGMGKATVGRKRMLEKRLAKKAAGKSQLGYFTLVQVRQLLAQSDKEIEESPDDWQAHRLRALLYFEAFTGARIEEVVHLEWHEIDFENGIAWLTAKIEHHLKTEGSEAPVGLSEQLLSVMQDWQTRKTCNWVFPNVTKPTPWTGGGPSYKSLDQLKALALRADIEHATWKMFRDTLTTLGKNAFGLTEAQVQAQLRHTTTKTQAHYSHDELMSLRNLANTLEFG